VNGTKVNNEVITWPGEHILFEDTSVARVLADRVSVVLPCSIYRLNHGVKCEATNVSKEISVATG